ncbi:hypothetical protein Ndes2526B_g04818 [Nannochloris sp. 'desiccata']
MSFSDLGFTITVAYEDLSDVWPAISKAITARLPLQQVALVNKLGTAVTVDHMPVELVSSFEPAVQKLQQYAYSALTWFRQPAASLVLISCNDAEDYKKNFRLQLRAMIDYEGRHPLSPEPVFVYIAPKPSPDVDPKGPGRVVDAMRRELGSRRRQRVARVDVVAAAGAAAATNDPTNSATASINKDSSADDGLQGIDEVIMCLKAAIAASLEARISAYGEVVRQHMTALQAARPDVCFSDLFLLKDSLAVMMEAAGLVEDSVREYLELEVAFQQVEQTKKQSSEPPSRLSSLSKSSDGLSEPQTSLNNTSSLHARQLEFLNGGLQPRKGIDEASGIWSDWRATRLSVQGIAFSLDRSTLESSFGATSSVPTAHNITHGDTTSLLALRQAVFASQSRVLLKLQRYSEVLERGLAFFHNSFSTLAAHEGQTRSTSSGSSKQSPKFFKEAWTFAGCISLAAAVASTSSLSQQQQQQQQQQQRRQEGKERAGCVSHYYLKGLLDDVEGPSEKEATGVVDWRLGLPDTSYQEALVNNSRGEFYSSSTTLAATASTRSMYCLLGQLYCAARAQLETLGAAHGLQPPDFKRSVVSSLSIIDAAARRGATAISSPGAGYIEDGSTSPRRTLHKARSMSPSRASVDLSVRSSFISAAAGGAAGGNHLAGFESGDEASSLSVRIQNQQNSPFDDVQENMQTIDLAAAMSGGDGDRETDHQDNDSKEHNGSGIAIGAGVATAETAPPFQQQQQEQQERRENLGPMAAAAMNAQSDQTTRATHELTSAQISADAAEKGVELMPVASVTSFPPVVPPASPSSSPLAAGLSASHHRRTNTGTSTKTSLQTSETTSEVSTPRSVSAASGSTAGVAMAAGATAAAAAGIMTPGAANGTATATSVSSPQDAGVALRKIERILDDLWAPLLDNKIGSGNIPSRRPSSSSSSMSASAKPTPTLARPSSAAGNEEDTGNVWKPVHWRLRRALASQTAFSDLWEALTVAAAVCFDHGGRQRQTVQCRAEIADCLAAKGQLADAARLYEAQCRTALAEGWNLAASAHLPKLAACQAALQSAGLPHTAAALLKLTSSFSSPSSSVFTASDAAASVSLLCRAAALPSAALPLPPPLLPPRQHMPGPGAAGTLPFIMNDTEMVELSSVLLAQPLKGSYSKFYCRNDTTTGRPVFRSTASADASAVSAATTATVTHVQCAVGDVNVITLKVYSRLPTAIALRDVRLLLLGMQEMTALASPRAASPSQSTAFRPSMQNMPLASAWNSTQHGTAGGSASTLHQQQVPTPSATMNGFGGGVGGGGGGMSQQSPFYRADSFADEGPRFTTEWQDTEDLQCSLVSISHHEEEGEEEEEEEARIKKKEKGDLATTALLTPFTGAVTLQPGVNILRFMAAPLKRGLYRPVRITAALYNLDICLDVEEHTSLSTTGCSLFSSNAHAPSSRMGVTDQGHVLSLLEDSAAYPVVLEVEPTLPRISIAPVAATGAGCLVAGQRQWLGLHVVPGRDVLENATLAVTWPVPPSEVARKMSGLLSHSTSTGLLGNSAIGGGGGAGGSLSPELSQSFTADGGDGGTGGGMVAALLPQHNAALVSTPFSEPISVVAASSLIHQDGQQEIAIPEMSSSININSRDGNGNLNGSGVTIWWWIEAGSFVSSPEQVKVIAPGQQQQQQFQDSGAGGGGAIDNAAATHSISTKASSPHFLLHLPLYLQYLSGCRRTFSKVVPLSLHHPFAVSTSARELPNESVVTHFNVSSLLPHAVTIVATSLVLQPGLHLVRDIATELNIFPMMVLPHSAFSLSFIVTVDRTMAAGDRASAQARLQQAAKMQPTALQLSYTIAIEESCYGVVGVEEESAIALGGDTSVAAALLSARNGAFAGHRTTVHGDTNFMGGEGGGLNQQHRQQTAVGINMHLPSVSALRALEETAATTTSPPSTASPFTSSAIQHQDQQQQEATHQQEYQECFFTHHCALELSPLESDIPGAVVLVHLLGPFSATAGQPVSLCWRLERAGAALQQGSTPTQNSNPQNISSSSSFTEPLRIQFEIGAQGDAISSWRPLGRRSGSVVLEPYDGAIATIEATWVPLVAGTIAVPSLRLADVAFQECFEVGGGSTNYLVVTPSPY